MRRRTILICTILGGQSNHGRVRHQLGTRPRRPRNRARHVDLSIHAVTRSATCLRSRIWAPLQPGQRNRFCLRWKSQSIVESNSAWKFSLPSRFESVIPIAKLRFLRLREMVVDPSRCSRELGCWEPDFLLPQGEPRYQPIRSILSFNAKCVEHRGYRWDGGYSRSLDSSRNSLDAR